MIDLDFPNLMTPADLKSLCQQISYSYRYAAMHSTPGQPLCEHYVAMKSLQPEHLGRVSEQCLLKCQVVGEPHPTAGQQIENKASVIKELPAWCLVKPVVLHHGTTVTVAMQKTGLQCMRRSGLPFIRIQEQVLVSVRNSAASRTIRRL